MDRKYLINNLHLVSIAMFAASLPFGCFTCGNSPISSLMVLLVGWMGMFKGGANSTWIANPLLAISWLFFTLRSYLVASVFSLLATILAFFFLFCHGVATDEGGAEHPVVSYLIGYWLWLLSCLIMFAGSFYSLLISHEKQEHNTTAQ
jgi:hypothetical protein